MNKLTLLRVPFPFFVPSDKVVCHLRFECHILRVNLVEIFVGGWQVWDKKDGDDAYKRRTTPHMCNMASLPPSEQSRLYSPSGTECTEPYTPPSTGKTDIVDSGNYKGLRGVKCSLASRFTDVQTSQDVKNEVMNSVDDFPPTKRAKHSQDAHADVLSVVVGNAPRSKLTPKSTA